MVELLPELPDRFVFGVVSGEGAHFELSVLEGSPVDQMSVRSEALDELARDGPRSVLHVRGMPSNR